MMDTPISGGSSSTSYLFTRCILLGVPPPTMAGKTHWMWNHGACLIRLNLPLCWLWYRWFWWFTHLKNFLATWQWNVSWFYPHIAPMAMRDQRKHSVDSLSDFCDQRFWMTLERTTKFAWTCTFCILWFSLGIVRRSECTLTNIEPRARRATSLFTALRHDDRGANSGMGHGGDRSHTVLCLEHGVYHGVPVHPI